LPVFEICAGIDGLSLPCFPLFLNRFLSTDSRRLCFWQPIRSPRILNHSEPKHLTHKMDAPINIREGDAFGVNVRAKLEDLIKTSVYPKRYRFLLAKLKISEKRRDDTCDIADKRAERQRRKVYDECHQKHQELERSILAKLEDNQVHLPETMAEPKPLPDSDAEDSREKVSEVGSAQPVPPPGQATPVSSLSNHHIEILTSPCNTQCEKCIYGESHTESSEDLMKRLRQLLADHNQPPAVNTQGVYRNRLGSRSIDEWIHVWKGLDRLRYAVADSLRKEVENRWQIKVQPSEMDARLRWHGSTGLPPA